MRSAEAMPLALDTEFDTLTSLLTHAGDALAFVSNEGVIERANATLAARFETSPDRLRGRRLTDIAPPELAESYDELWTRAFVHRERVEWTSGHDNRIWRDTLAPNPSGGVLFYGRDVTEQRRAESALEMLDARFHEVAERFGFGIGWLTEEGLTYANAAFSRMFGWERPLGQGPAPIASLTRALHPEDRDTIQRQWHPATRSRSSERTTVRILRPGRDTMLVDVTSQLVDLPTARGVLVSVNDISDRQEIFQRLLREEKEESLVAIAGGLAHDFNSILVGILSSVTMLQDEVESSRSALELCDIISTAARRMADMTGQLLMYSRGAPFRPADVDVNQIVRDVFSMVWGGVPPSVKLISDLAPQRLVVRGDASQLHQLILTLIVNALEAVESAGTTVRARTRVDGQQVRLEIIDDGVGMTEQTRTRLFEPFFSTKFHGRGLGLAAARGIIEAHGGEVEVQSSPGAGSAFCVVLPLSRPAGEAREDVHVALFDPDPLIGRMTKRLLRRSGFEVEAFDDADTFEARLRSGATNLAGVVVDRLSGASILERVGASISEVPVVWLEASREVGSELPDHDRRRCVRLAKPFDARSLLRALNAVVSAGSAEGR